MIGNPPFIRYQDFSGEARARSRTAARRAGVGLSNLASSWAAFAVHAALFLRPGGRMGLVLPAELLSVNYAAQVRRFSTKRVDSSFGNNAANRVEESYGDAKNLRPRHPQAALGFVYSLSSPPRPRASPRRRLDRRPARQIGPRERRL